MSSDPVWVVLFGKDAFVDRHFAEEKTQKYSRVVQQKRVAGEALEKCELRDLRPGADHHRTLPGPLLLHEDLRRQRVAVFGSLQDHRNHLVHHAHRVLEEQPFCGHLLGRHRHHRKFGHVGRRKLFGFSAK